MARLVIEPEDEGSWRCRQILGNAERPTGECGAEEGGDRKHVYENAASRGILLL